MSTSTQSTQQKDVASYRRTKAVPQGMYNLFWWSLIRNQNLACTHAYTCDFTATSHKHLRSRCGQCEGCLRASDCGQCVECLDKKKFGGPGRKKKACKYKKCTGISSCKQTNGNSIQESINKLSSLADHYTRGKYRLLFNRLSYI